MVLTRRCLPHWTTGQRSPPFEARFRAHVAFLKGFADTCRFGDYLFVHAGIRPGDRARAAEQSDLRWIREPFLLDDTDHGFVVVHGHTISNEVEERENRIGIDTGAYRTRHLDRPGDRG